MTTPQDNSNELPSPLTTRLYERAMLVLSVASFMLLTGSFIGYSIRHHFDLSLFLSSWFVNWPSSHLAGDITFVLVAFWIWAIGDQRRARTPYWWLVFPLSLLVGIGCAVPTYLWLRERHLRLTRGRLIDTAPLSS